MRLGYRSGAGIIVAIVAALGALSATAGIFEFKSGLIWPQPKVIDPGTSTKAPSDAVVLFDGQDLSKWVDGEQWLIENGSAVSRGRSIRTKQSFGDCQLHLEWAAPEKAEGAGQGRGNSGVHFLGKYELQILDSYQNETYYDGQCAAVYKQHPPLVNACRKPGEWQTYDVIFKGPRFDEQGKLIKPGSITVLHNGVLVQDHFELQGDTSYIRAPRYAAHPPKLPLELQYHRNPVRFRNIWIRELVEEQPPKKGAEPGPVKPESKPKKPSQPVKKKATTKPDSPKNDNPKTEKQPSAAGPSASAMKGKREATAER